MGKLVKRLSTCPCLTYLLHHKWEALYQITGCVYRNIIDKNVIDMNTEWNENYINTKSN